jgi:hypothetical protein
MPGKRIMGDDQARFWSHVDKNGPIHPRLGTPCWLWTGYRNKRHRYGYINIARKQVRVSRYSFFLAHGRWPEPVCRHRCDVRLCVNPAHLIEGTTADNANDMVRRGRSMKGERHPNRKLSATDIRNIRERLADGETGSRLAEIYGVQGSQISRIKNGQQWGHLTT